MVDKLRLSRSQLARIVGNDPEAIRQFELLFSDNGINTVLIEEVAIAAANAAAAANRANDLADGLNDRVAFLEQAPRVEAEAPASSGGSALTLTTVEADLGSNAKTGGRFTIAGAGLTPGKPVLIAQAVGPYTGKGTRADEAEMDQVNVAASVTDASTITAYWSSARRVKGNFKFNYQVSA